MSHVQFVDDSVFFFRVKAEGMCNSKLILLVFDMDFKA